MRYILPLVLSLGILAVACGSESHTDPEGTNDDKPLMGGAETPQAVGEEEPDWDPTASAVGTQAAVEIAEQDAMLQQAINGDEEAFTEALLHKDSFLAGVNTDGLPHPRTIFGFIDGEEFILSLANEEPISFRRDGIVWAYARRTSYEGYASYASFVLMFTDPLSADRFVLRDGYSAETERNKTVEKYSKDLQVVKKSLDGHGDVGRNIYVRSGRLVILHTVQLNQGLFDAGTGDLLFVALDEFAGDSQAVLESMLHQVRGEE